MKFKDFLAEGLTDKAEQLLKATGNVVADEAECGDYELFVVYNKMMKMYQIAMQLKGKDFTDLQQQGEKGNSQLGNFNRKQFKEIIQNWLNEFGELIVASHDNRKTEIYVNLLKVSGFKTRNFGPFVVIEN